MNRTQVTVRARILLDEWLLLVVIALLTIGAFGGWFVYTAYADEPIETEQQSVEKWATIGGYSHSAEVTQVNPVFDEGSVLSNHPIYYSEITPELDGDFSFQFAASDGQVESTIEIEQVIRSADDDREHWEIRERIATSENDSLEPHSQHSTSFSVNVSELDDTTEQIESSLGDSPGTIETFIVTTVSMNGTVDDEPVRIEEEYVMDLAFEGDTYTVEAPISDRRGVEEYEPVESDQDTDLTMYFLGGLLMILSVSGIATLSLAKRNDALTPSGRKIESYRSATERDRLSDWITRGAVPADVRERPHVTVDSLEGLVDIAIDAETQVIETITEDGPSYWVVGSDVPFVFRPSVSSHSVETDSVEADKSMNTDMDSTDSDTD